MFQFITNGGPIMFLLLACSVAGVTIIVHKYLFFKFHFFESEKTCRDIKDKLLTYGKHQTLLKLRSEQKIIVQVLGQAIELSSQPRDAIQDGIRESVYNEIPKIDQAMPILSSIITAAPILGLMGTVIGLMDLFNVISGGGLGDTQALSAGIATALITTVTGLFIALPFIFFYQHFSQKIEHYVIELERISYDMIGFCQANDAVES